MISTTSGPPVPFNIDTVPRGGGGDDGLSDGSYDDYQDLDAGDGDETLLAEAHDAVYAANTEQVTHQTMAKSSSPAAKSSTLSFVAVGLSQMTSKLSTYMARSGRFYSTCLESNPIITKSITAGIIFGLSDYLAQMIEQQQRDSDGQDGVSKNSGKVSNVDGSTSASSMSFDWTRMIASTLIGLCYFGPAAHYWYEWIFRIFPATTLVSTMVKAFWGQILFGPSFTCIFFAVSLLQSGDFTFGGWFRKIRSDLPGAWLAGSGYWPIIDLISYSFVPVKLIPLFINMASLIWTVYLSIVANKKSAATK